MSVSYSFKPNKAGLSQLRKALFQGVIAGSEKMLSLANRYIPLDEGTLLRSGVASYEESSLTGCVSYNTPYAKRLHEHPEYHFQNGRRGKWLKDTVDTQHAQIMKSAHQAIKGGM